MEHGKNFFNNDMGRIIYIFRFFIEKILINNFNIKINI